MVAQELLGKILVRKFRGRITAGVIVETEAYLAENDPACHTNRGKTPRNATMFERPGTAYVYSIHARYCFNAVTEAAGRGCAVLIRAIEPLDGIDLMRRRRPKASRDLDLARGPARLCEALSITKRLDGCDLTRGDKLWISSEPSVGRLAVGRSGRIGISAAQELPLRFFVEGNRYVSGSKRL